MNEDLSKLLLSLQKPIGGCIMTFFDKILVLSGRDRRPERPSGWSGEWIGRLVWWWVLESFYFFMLYVKK